MGGGEAAKLENHDTTSHCSKISRRESGTEGRRNGLADKRGNKGAGLTSIGVQIP